MITFQTWYKMIPPTLDKAQQIPTLIATRNPTPAVKMTQAPKAQKQKLTKINMKTIGYNMQTLHPHPKMRTKLR